MFNSLLSSNSASLSLENFVICTLCSIVLGVLIAVVYRKEGNTSKNFTLSLVVLPMLVQMVIMMVNGNLGTSVAVLGTFGLVRFRSVPGTSKEICFVFLAMAIGLATGTGFVAYAVVLTLLASFIIMVIKITPLMSEKTLNRDLRITIPEDLDYTEVFDDLFEKYTSKVKLMNVKTTHLGSLYEIRYEITLKDEKKEKAFIDDLRCRNGNLTIVSGRTPTIQETL